MNEDADVCNCSAIQLESWDNRQRACAVKIPRLSNFETHASQKDSLKVVKEENQQQEAKEHVSLEPRDSLYA